jgi:hypothetical protein
MRYINTCTKLATRLTTVDSVSISFPEPAILGKEREALG